MGGKNWICGFPVILDSGHFILDIFFSRGSNFQHNILAEYQQLSVHTQYFARSVTCEWQQGFVELNASLFLPCRKGWHSSKSVNDINHVWTVEQEVVKYYVSWTIDLYVQDSSPVRKFHRCQNLCQRLPEQNCFPSPQTWFAWII